MEYRLIEDGNGWFVIQYYSEVDKKWKEHRNWYNCYDGAKGEVYDLKGKKRKNELKGVVTRIIEEF